MPFRPNVNDELPPHGMTCRARKDVRNHQVTKTQSSLPLRVFVPWW
jgi:hypothetical protein